MNNNLIVVNEHFKRLKNFKYGFHTIIPGSLMNLYDINNDDNRAYHHILEYKEEIELFKYPIMITAILAKFISDYIKEVEIVRKKEKLKPKEVQILYAIKEHPTYIDFLPYVEGMDFPSKYMKIDLLTANTIIYKKQMEVLERIKIICPDKRHISEYVLEPGIYNHLKENEDVAYIDLEIDEKIINYPLAASVYATLRKAPENLTIEIANTKNELIFMVTVNYDTELYKEKHISFVLYG